MSRTCDVYKFADKNRSYSEFLHENCHEKQQKSMSLE